MISVIALSDVTDAGRPSRYRTPAMPHIASTRSLPDTATPASNLSLGAALIDLIDMRLAPFDQPAQAFIEIDAGLESDFFLRSLWRADPVAHQRRLAAGRIVDGLI